MALHNAAKTGTGILLLVVSLIALNIIAANIFGRVDVTENDVYSLSDGTRSILKDLDGETDARLYFSRSNKELPVAIKTYATRVEEVLREYASQSGDKINVEIVDPKPDTDEEEWARKYGIQPVRLPQGDQLYFGVVFLKGSKEIVIPYLDPRREEFLEYDLSEAIVGLGRKEKAKVGIISSLPVVSEAGQFGRGGESWALVDELRKNFEVEAIDPNTAEISAEYGLVIAIHPKNPSDKLQYALDQYVMHGGKLVVAVDAMSRADLMSSQQNPMMGQMPEPSSDLPKLFSSWGITFNKETMVGDVARASNINAGGQIVTYPFFIALRKEDMSSDSVITNNLNQIVYAEGGSFKFTEKEGYKFEPIIQTTKDSGTASGKMAAYMGPAQVAADLKVDDQQHTLVGLLTGTFKSAFSAQASSLTDEEKKQISRPHRAQSESAGAIVLIGDVDFLTDSNSVSKINFAGQRLVQLRNDNLNLLFNAVDFLGGSEALISIRSRGKIARPFTKVAEIQKEAQFKWKKKEEELSAELQRLQSELGKLQQQRTDGNRFALSAEQQERIKQFREEERKIRRERRIVRKNLREDIESLGSRLVAINMLVVPLFVSLFGVGMFVRRSKLMREGKNRG